MGNPNHDKEGKFTSGAGGSISGHLRPRFTDEGHPEDQQRQRLARQEIRDDPHVLKVANALDRKASEQHGQRRSKFAMRDEGDHIVLTGLPRDYEHTIAMQGWKQTQEGVWGNHNSDFTLRKDGLGRIVISTEDIVAVKRKLPPADRFNQRMSDVIPPFRY